MKKALELASRGGRDVEPNPLVGCVIVKAGRVVGRGWHKRFGGPHAEIEALRNAGGDARGATMYVTLEPCNHAGKTPPCTDAIIAAGIAKVVIANVDNNPEVAGEGRVRLGQAGIECLTGVMDEEARLLNERFFVNTTLRRPFVRLKVAQTLDGFLAPLRGTSRWITSDDARARVHEMRAAVDAVLVGSETVRKDNPVLTVRSASGRNPLRIVLTSEWNLSPKQHLFGDGEAGNTIIASSKRAIAKHRPVVDVFRSRGIRVLECTNDVRDRVYLPVLLKELLAIGVTSLLVEGGANVFSEFIEQGFADRVDLFIAPTLLGAGIGSFRSLKPRTLPDAHRFSIDENTLVGGDVHLLLRPRKER